MTRKIPVELRVLIAVGLAAPSLAPAQTPASTPLKMPYAFTAAQLAQLKATGCALNAGDLQAFARMKARGFSATAAGLACTRAARMKLRGARDMEHLATLDYLGLPTHELAWIKARRLTLTRYYNRGVGRRGVWIWGWIVGGVGLATSVMGIVFYAGGFEDCEKPDPSHCTPKQQSNDEKLGLGLSVVGGLAVGAGVTMLITSRIYRDARLAPAGVLEQGTLEQMRRFRRRPARTAHGPRFAISPFVGRGGGGLAAAGVF